MSIFTMTETEFERDCRWLFETVTETLDKIAKLLTETPAAVNCGPRYVAGFVAPYSFAGKLRLLFEFARGKKQLSRQLVDEVTLDFYRMMSMSPFSAMTLDDDDDDAQSSVASQRVLALEWIQKLRPHPISIVILAAQARAKLSLDKWISEPELEALTELTAPRAAAFNIQSRTLDSGRIEFAPNDVRAFLVKV